MDFSEGVTEQVTGAEPGTLHIACWPFRKHGGPEPETVPIEIHDSEGYWDSGDLECRGDAVQGGIMDYLELDGTKGDPEEIARRSSGGIKPSDDVTTVGYPEGNPRLIAVIRGGRRIGLLRYAGAPKGGWYLEGYSSCPSAGLGI
jgi:hypothetical protein